MDVLKQLHTSVTRSFEDSFDHAHRDLNAELARRDGRIREAEAAAKIAGETRRSTAARVQELEQEIAALKKELQPCGIDAKSKKFAISMQETYGPERVLVYLDSAGLDDLHPEVKTQIVEIGAKYRTLYINFQDLIGVCGALRTKVDIHKQKLMQWQDRVNRKEFTIELSGTPARFQRVHEASNTKNHSRPSPSRSKKPVSEPLESTDQRVSTPAPTAKLDKPNLAPAKGLHEKDVQYVHGARGHPGSVDPELPEPASTRFDPSLPSEETASTDTSTGTVRHQSKRKRVSQPEPHPQSSSSHDGFTNGRLQHPIVIKIESTSSSPLRDFSEYRPPIGTQDLDEIGSSIETPTKKNRRNPHSPKTSNTSVTNAPKAAGRFEDDYGEFHCPESEQMTSNHSRVLQPVDINSRPASFSGQQISAKSRKSLKKTSKHAIPSVTEDGESYSTSNRIQNHTPSINMGQSLSNTNHAPVQQRLQGLLEEPPPSRSPLNVRRNPVHSADKGQSPVDSHGAVNQSPTEHDQTASTASVESLQTMQKPMRTGSGYGQEPSSINDRAKPTEMRPQNERYRVWPLDRLELNNFKVNPDYNQGFNFAYNTVARKKDGRRCMNGCTRADCCGDKFRSMARIGGLTNLKGFGQEAEEREILEEYLGEEKHLLDTLGPGDRKGLLLEAQARRLANVYGKHRQTHQRPRTPPGFWRTDMPDTQELENDREEARKLEREEIYERYREARRPGGLWKFADE